MELNTKQPFSRSSASAAGVGWRSLSTNFRRVAHDRHVSAEVPDDLIVRCRALEPILGRDKAFSHHTAAVLWGGAVPLSAAIHMAVRGQYRVMRTDLKVHRFTYPIDMASRLSFRVTSPEMTVGHMARELDPRGGDFPSKRHDLIDLVALGDSLVRSGRTTAGRLQAYADSWPGQHRRLFMQASGLVRERVASPQETRTRMLLVLAGLPEPDCDVEVLRGGDPSVEWRLDLAYPRWLVAIEYDGAWHRDSTQAEHDRTRRSILAKMGWHVIVVKAADLTERPQEMLTQVRDALATRGARVPSRLSDHWRRHFRVALRAA